MSRVLTIDDLIQHPPPVVRPVDLSKYEIDLPIGLKGMRVLVRVDFNVPLESGKVTDDTRLTASLPTVKALLDRGARVILMSHLGRPKGKAVPEMSLRPVAERFGELLGKKVGFVPDCIGPEAETAVAELKDGECLLLENLRFHPEETANDPRFAAQLASHGDCYVNDAFGSAHRAHASTEGVAKRFPDKAAAGYLMMKELEYLGDKLEEPTRPFLVVLGGAKVSGKIEVIENLIEKVNGFVIGGGMAFTFLAAQGVEVGGSLVEEDRIDVASGILRKAESAGVEFLLPVDVIVASEISPDTEREVVSVERIPPDKQGLDIGPKTVELFSRALSGAKTVVWNGPMGVFEVEGFAAGTFAISRALSDATAAGTTTIVGGGDTAAAVAKTGGVMSHVSTGGGASLEFLEGKTLPGVAALSRVG
jgi:phosphoglycerate kinase